MNTSSRVGSSASVRVHASAQTGRVEVRFFVCRGAVTCLPQTATQFGGSTTIAQIGAGGSATKTVPLARADWPKQIAHHAIAFHWKAAIEQPAQYAVPIPLSLYISASGTRRYERDAWSASPGNLRRAQFTLLSLKGPCSVHLRCARSAKLHQLSPREQTIFWLACSAPPAMSLWRQQDAMPDATAAT